MQTEGSDTKPLFADDRSKAGEYIVPGALTFTYACCVMHVAFAACCMLVKI